MQCGPREEFQLNGKKALSSHSTRGKDRCLSAVATGRFLFCLYREKYLHISFWRAFSLYLTSAADLNSLVLLPGGLLWLNLTTFGVSKDLVSPPSSEYTPLLCSRYSVIWLRNVDNAQSRQWQDPVFSRLRQSETNCIGYLSVNG